MQARLSQYSVDPDRVDEAIRGFQEASIDLRQLDGNKGGYVLVDRETGQLFTITFWDGQGALTSSEVRAAGLRKRAMEAAQGSVESVRCFEVAVEFPE
jgi:heme-degrading monooxygenase HmoA